MSNNYRAKAKAPAGLTVSLAMGSIALLAFGAAMLTYGSTVGNAISENSFVNIFYTNSFRGAFQWIHKLDWVGGIVQCVISVFSLLGVALLVIRIMTSMLYLSAKGMWEEVHDLKATDGGGDKYDLGLMGMAKTWASGKSGTGLDAIIGAVLIFLPDVKKYSDFGEKSGQKFEEDINISQYMLKILVPTVMTVFFFAMGFNGTLFQALAVTVDAMGSLADRAVAINYTGFVDDMVNKGTGYKFIFDADGTALGKMRQRVAKDVYGRLCHQLNGANAAQLYAMGQQLEQHITDVITYDNLANAPQVSEKVKNGLTNSDSMEMKEQYLKTLSVKVFPNGAATASNELEGSCIDTAAWLGALPGVSQAQDQRPVYIHFYVEQDDDTMNNFFNNNG